MGDASRACGQLNIAQTVKPNARPLIQKKMVDDFILIVGLLVKNECVAYILH